MSDNTPSHADRQRAKPGQSWETTTAEKENLEWSIDAADGLVQGPLDLNFLHEKTMLLTLREEQIALVLDNGDLSSIYLAGNHRLEINRAEGNISPDNKMIFLAAENPITVSWKQNSSVWATNIGSSPEEIKIIGNCACGITGPGHFYQTFLANLEKVDEELLIRVIDGLIRSQIEQRLADIFQGRPFNAVELQSRLTRLTAEDLSDDLDQYGLSCIRLAVYTSKPPVESHDSETTGQLSSQGEYWY